MPTSIVAYRKHSDPYTTVTLRLPDSLGDEGEIYCTELATLDGVTYVSVPDGATLPEQPPELDPQPVVLTPELKAALRAASPHCALISERMVQKIRARYSTDEEDFFARIGVGAGLGIYQISHAEMAEIQAFGEFVEAVRQWGRAERARLGL